MKAVKLVTLCLCLCGSVSAQEYVEIIDSGESYSNYAFTKGNLKEFLSPERIATLSEHTNPFYHSAVGHMGKLLYEFDVDKLGHLGGKRLVLDIDGNYIVVNKSAYKPANKSKYLAFQNKINQPIEFFGLKVGSDQFTDVIAKLIPSKINHKLEQLPNGSLVIEIYDDPNVPQINDIAVTSHRLHFDGTVLSAIEFWWDPTSKKMINKIKYNKNEIYESLIQGIRDKYTMDQTYNNNYAIITNFVRGGEFGDKKVDSLWVSSTQHISVETWNDYPHIKLTYNSTNSLKSALRQAEKDEANHKQQKAKKNAASL